MDVVRAIEDNAAELLMAMGAAGGGSQRVDERATWTIGGSPIDYHNAVVRATDTGVIAESLAELRKHDVPGTWHAGPSLQIDRTALTDGGFSAAGSEPGMAVRVPELIAPRDVPGLAITRVEDDDALAVWEATLGQGFGEGEREARWVASTYRTLGYGDPWRHYVGWLDGMPVGTATVFLGAGVAGLYFVMTVPAARRRGIGAALTYGVLRSVDAEYAVLGSSAAGRSVYEALGFREYCTIELYEWTGSSTSAG
ncbi:GNAT family N-acetyltransferase [Kribbella sp.]|uniref:GNAT family N-acetyltransferase n=1 Tax=Kribbella sp. TaxID=1871183 RepID=UPI002D6354CA|nr:GNAT family N-acetyltransferase [Kribbella sp.]HZX01344.1 GNAT family N-acetyltransferase [Kribbella sp.]